MGRKVLEGAWPEHIWWWVPKEGPYSLTRWAKLQGKTEWPTPQGGGSTEVEPEKAAGLEVKDYPSTNLPTKCGFQKWEQGVFSREELDIYLFPAPSLSQLLNGEYRKLYYLLKTFVSIEAAPSALIPMRRRHQAKATANVLCEWQ